MENSQNYQSVSEVLKGIGWDWNHPRIVAYIQDLSSRHKTKYTPENLPEKHCIRLVNLLRIYRRINRMLIESQNNWKSPFITQFFNNHSIDDAGKITYRLKFKKWIELERLVIDACCPF